jgi:hypothetical protein
MRSNYILSLILLAAAVWGVLFLNADEARAQNCNIEFRNEVRGVNQSFEFTFLNGNGEFTDSFGGGSGESFSADPNLEIIETPIAGYELKDVQCETLEGAITFIEIENGVSIHCFQDSSLGACTFRNVQTDAIPTLSEWGMIAAAAALMLAGVLFAVRRHWLTTEK